MRATAGSAIAAGGIHHQVRIDDGLQVADVAGSASASPVHVEAGLSRDHWDFACASFGLSFGGVMYGKTGAVIGGVAGYIYGRKKWPGVDESDD